MDDFFDFFGEFLAELQLESLEISTEVFAEHLEMFSMEMLEGLNLQAGADFLDNMDLLDQTDVLGSWDTGLDGGIDFANDLLLDDVAGGEVIDADVATDFSVEELLDQFYVSEAAGDYSLGAADVDFGASQTTTELGGAYHMQEAVDTCAIRCQLDIVEDMTGKALDEGTIAHVMEQLDFYNPGSGTPMHAVGEVLEACGIDCEQPTGADVDDLREWIAEGKHIVVGVDSTEVLDPSATLAEVDFMPGADHAVRVVGFETDAVTGQEYVILNDPDVGPGLRLPVGQFDDAWADSGRFACVTV